MKNKRVHKNILLMCMAIIFVGGITKAIQFKMLPAKYFYDSNTILKIIKYGIYADKSYVFTANFFKYTNLLGFNSLAEWSWSLFAVGSIILIYVYLYFEKYNYKECVFLLCSTFFLNLYVFNLSKDFIQFLIFYIIFFVLKSRLSNIKKLGISCIILAIESFYFRIYYLIMGIFMINLFFLYTLFIKRKEKNNRYKIKILVLSLLLFFGEVFILQKLSNNNYNSIMNARYSVNISREDSTDAYTMINDIFGVNRNYFIFICNYVVNFIRLLFPVELLVKGIKYSLFAVYQCFISIGLIKTIKLINKNNILIISAFISFIMVSAIFEPDFGSFIRHETSTIPILVLMLKNNAIRRKKNGKI